MMYSESLPLIPDTSGDAHIRATDLGVSFDVVRFLGASVGTNKLMGNTCRYMLP